MLSNYWGRFFPCHCFLLPLLYFWQMSPKSIAAEERSDVGDGETGAPWRGDQVSQRAELTGFSALSSAHSTSTLPFDWQEPCVITEVQEYLIHPETWSSSDWFWQKSSFTQLLIAGISIVAHHISSATSMYGISVLILKLHWRLGT